jgi:hypothetical protein
VITTAGGDGASAGPQLMAQSADATQRHLGRRRGDVPPVRERRVLRTLASSRLAYVFMRSILRIGIAVVPRKSSAPTERRTASRRGRKRGRGRGESINDPA